MKLNIAAAYYVAISGATVGAMSCQNVTVPISIEARNGVYNLTVPTNNIDVTNFVLDATRPGGNYSKSILSGYRTVSGDYNISGTFCQPSDRLSKTLQILTHGLSADKTYWDASFNGYNYSYARKATDVHKYATFFYDRLGAGLSSHPDPVQDTQVWLEVESLAALTNMARDGLLPGTNGTRFEKIIHVGHSFGSVQTNTLTTLYPNISDAIVLTGFSLNDTYQPDVIFGGNLLQANNISRFAETFSQNGYVAVGDVSAVQQLFFGPGDFAQPVLEGAFETANPIAIGELLMSTGTSGVNNTFCGPVLIVTGEHDVPFCGGNCLDTGDPDVPSIPASGEKFFPNAQDFNATVIPNAGHVLNLAYDTIFEYLAKHGLAPA